MIELKIPELAESITGGTVVEWFVETGAIVKKGDPVLEIETDKINVEIPANTSGVIKSIRKQVEEEVNVGDIVAIIDDKHELSSGKAEKVDTQPTVQGRTIHTGELKKAVDYIVATPSARKKARQLAIDLKELNGQVPLTRIQSSDVEAFAKQKELINEKVENKAPTIDFVQEEKQVTNNTKNERAKQIERIKMSPRRRTIAKRLVEAQQEAAMLTTFNEIDLSVVMEIRTKRKDTFFKKHGVKLGFMSFFTKAVVMALKEFPVLNAELQDDEILLKKFYDIGIAVSTNDGLVVPVLRAADELGFAQIEAEIGRLGEKAKARKLELSDLQGGTFTITNGGVFGSLFSTPILNTPQVGILGMHTIQKRPVVLEDDTIVVQPMMYVALSYDHRIVDGKDAVQFLKYLKQLLETPYDLLLES
ncbi:2-oxoglutarate dehydrogenase complex dihydrolipoyllysine-residue succinyltransferase [Paraliobacillus sediminis]|uniref:2-oxoglutarate dehydrogenase complex dihydrolipoyllysine-residue succinyltransferase n=1 Tax=Paraliobacillus sediminis TaxID=1885916 RepID=UPI000E3C5027|nr:2-oxoglutarate dehydrogenase complex dihydrolipoyllysine-residue succinyltransferase [Paraliobacillus sediminis]